VEELMTARPIRQKLLSSAAMIGAMALAGLATRSEAAPIPPIDNTRVIQATDTADPGHSYAPGGALDVITINAPTAIINWTPLDPAANPIGFVKQNGEARFQSANDFAVLNRVTPTNGHPIQFDGAVTSFVNGTRGGTVMFYSADGFIIAPTGTLNVGSLVLTTGDITDPAFTGSSFKIGTPNLGATITNNGSITANNYVVLASPKIVQSGTVTSPTTAYVAAGATSFTFSNGLFDILVDNPIDNAQITHSAGATTEIKDNPDQTFSRAYFVAVPKNDAMALFLTGNIGYPAIDNATQKNGFIILSAGSSVREIGSSAAVDPIPNAGKAGIELTNTNVNANISAHAVGDLTLQATGNGLLQFGTGFSFTSDTGAIQLLADGGDINVAGSVQLFSLGGPAGSAAISVSNGHSIEIQGNLELYALDNRTSGDAQGGTTSITVNDGSLIASAGFGGSQLIMDASATASGNDAGNATGGNVTIDLTNATFVTDDLTMRANAAAANAPAAGGAAGIGQGGTITFETHPTTDVTLKTITMSAYGQGGAATPQDFSLSPVEGDPSGKGGLGNGGTITISLDGGASSNFDLNSISAAVLAGGGNGQGNCIHCTGQDGQDAGDAIGGTINFTVASGSVGNNGTSLTFDTGSQGGYGNNGFRPTTVNGGDAGEATGGNSIVTITGGTLTINSLTLKANATAGKGGDSIEHDDITDPMHPKVPGGIGGAAGESTGGTATITVSGGKLVSTGLIDVEANANGFQAGYGDVHGGTNAVGQGGTAGITVSGTGSIQGGSLSVSANGKGAAGHPGGDGHGGSATITVDGGVIDAGSVGASATGDGGIGLRNFEDRNGTGRGGTATITIENGGTMTTSGVIAGADGFGEGEAGNADKTGTVLGGGGTGGDAHIVLQDANSTLNVTGSLTVSSTGYGAFGEASGGDGDNSGAVAELVVNNGAQLNYTGSEDILIDASAGGGGTIDFNDPVQFDDSTGGAAKGGTAQLIITGATLTLPANINVTLDSSATAGEGYGTGGDATGGSALLRVNPGGSFHASNDVTLDASATAGRAACLEMAATPWRAVPPWTPSPAPPRSWGR
jgi:filamentous hemagglutinin family protein